ncbi:MAG: hypothetical protein GF335_00665 [Candidatus Moranbacteria bacterium]|nr:hypothetical protein [Candidatus Moranbacteria bacterium]
MDYFKKHTPSGFSISSNKALMAGLVILFVFLLILFAVAILIYQTKNSKPNQQISEKRLPNNLHQNSTKGLNDKEDIQDKNTQNPALMEKSFYIKSYSSWGPVSGGTEVIEVTPTAIFRVVEWEDRLGSNDKLLEYYEAKLTEKEFLELIDYVINKQKFFDLREEVYHEYPLMDAGFSSVIVGYGEKNHEVGVLNPLSSLEYECESCADSLTRFKNVKTELINYKKKLLEKKDNADSAKNISFGPNSIGSDFEKGNNDYPVLSIKEINNLKKTGKYTIEAYLAYISYCPPCPEGASCVKCNPDHLVFTDNLNKFKDSSTKEIKFSVEDKEFQKLFRNSFECGQEELAVDLSETSRKIPFDWTYFTLDSKYKLTVEIKSKASSNYYTAYDCWSCSDDFYVIPVSVKKINY